MAVIRKYRQFIKFTFVAATYNIAAYVLYALLLYINIYYIIASTISFVFGVTLSYYMNKSIVFSTEILSYKKTIFYICFYCMSLLFNLSMLHILVRFYGLNPYVAQTIVTITLSIFSYHIFRSVIFGIRESK
jgi:putative flippase GtrA